MDSEPNSSHTIRLNKLLASQLSLGRRQADFLIEKGKVTVNGHPAILGAQVNENDTIIVQGKPLAAKAILFEYVVLNKPTGYVCSRKQQGETPTIYSLLPAKLQHLKPVGRLDKDSSGLILLTNDGTLAYKLTHPRFQKIKEYIATLDKPLTPLHRQMIETFGVALTDGPSKLTLERVHEGNDLTWKVIMHEGRNRQIRRTFQSLGYEVRTLHRTVFGPLALGTLKSGSSEALDAKSLSLLQQIR